jgi:hypothetical protein
MRSFDADLFTGILAAILLGLVLSLILITNTGSITGVGLRSTLMSWSGVSIVGLRNSGDWQMPMSSCNLDFWSTSLPNAQRKSKGAYSPSIEKCHYGGKG